GEVERARTLEPLLRTRRFLEKSGLWDATRERRLLEECGREVDAAVAEYLATPPPTTDAMFDHMFESLPEHLREQRTAARRLGTGPGRH
ncbi:MAG: pyruvate dehydrogenase (acetyl-transferring) E1 component subunit alpha, partial [Steroidobacteraceae bacterium]|nr:pyruvate dehydrogenase (acetyl-transferring) E1 component subunit alpha [Steroidobacteraceae bacterium]